MQVLRVWWAAILAWLYRTLRRLAWWLLASCPADAQEMAKTLHAVRTDLALPLQTYSRDLGVLLACLSMHGQVPAGPSGFVVSHLTARLGHPVTAAELAGVVLSGQ